MNIPAYIPEIRFADIDAMGHVNNAVYLSYFEQARIHFFQSIVGTKWDWNQLGLLVARNEVDYRLPVLLNDRIEVRVRCIHLGTKSFSLAYEVVRGEAICCNGISVMVCFDYLEKRSIPVPDEWREKLFNTIT